MGMRKLQAATFLAFLAAACSEPKMHTKVYSPDGNATASVVYVNNFDGRKVEKFHITYNISNRIVSADSYLGRVPDDNVVPDIDTISVNCDDEDRYGFLSTAFSRGSTVMKFTGKDFKVTSQEGECSPPDVNELKRMANSLVMET